MEVDDLELPELVNDYQERSDEPTFNIFRQAIFRYRLSD